MTPTASPSSSWVSFLAKDKVMFVPIEALYWTGMRLGELLALTPNDIDFNRSEIHIRHSFKKVKGKDTITPPKTEKSVRKIVVPEFLRDEIRDHIENVSQDETRCFKYRA